MYVKIIQSSLNNRIECQVCVRQCQIPATEGARGFCGNSVVRGGRLELSCAGYTPMRYKDPLRRLPVLGFAEPDTEVLSIGGIGCNFRCPWCWNASCAWEQAGEVNPAEWRDFLSPEGAVGLAKRLGVEGIAFSNSEPTTLFPWVLETMRLTKGAGLFTVWSTNGSATLEALELAIPTLDVFRVGIKGPQAAYDRIAPGVRLEEIQAAVEFVRSRGVHIEVVVSVVPGLGDKPSWWQNIAAWIGESLGWETPTHFEVIYPAHQWTKPAPSRQAIRQAVQAAQDVGLRKVYIYDMGGGPNEH